MAELIRRFIPVHAAIYDDDTIDAALEFYRSPQGRKFMGAQDTLFPRVMEIAQAYGLELAQAASSESTAH